jgi:hypothetical protein
VSGRRQPAAEQRSSTRPDSLASIDIARDIVAVDVTRSGETSLGQVNREKPGAGPPETDGA